MAASGSRLARRTCQPQVEALESRILLMAPGGMGMPNRPDPLGAYLRPIEHPAESRPGGPRLAILASQATSETASHARTAEPGVPLRKTHRPARPKHKPKPRTRHHHKKHRHRVPPPMPVPAPVPSPSPQPVFAPPPPPGTPPAIPAFGLGAGAGTSTTAARVTLVGHTGPGVQVT